MPDDHTAPLFEVDDLWVGFGDQGGGSVVRGVSASLAAGESLGVVGESGSGKSVTFLAALGLLPGNGFIRSGEVRLDGTDLVRQSRTARRRHLGRDLAMIFQNPMTALNPVLSIGAQIIESLRAHEPSLSKADAWQRAVDLLERVGITQPARRAAQYPHEFSGGMCQRAMIAIAIANKPRVLVADEPTTAVDVTLQAQILELLDELASETGMGTVLISHDLGVIAQQTDQVLVMYGGQVMERGATDQVLSDPRHPYTQGLLSCRPSLHRPRALVPIAGAPPDPTTLDEGCPFVERCPIGRADQKCRDVTPALVPHDGRPTACHHAGEVAFGTDGGGEEQEGEAAPAPEPSVERALMVGGQLRCEFGGRGLFGRRRDAVVAVDGVDVELRPGETLGVVGESGSGKSTVARLMMRLVAPTSGTLLLAGDDITAARGRHLRGLRDRVQIVFQDPFNSVNPKLTVADNAADPLRIKGVGKAERRRRVSDLFEEVGLPARLMGRMPHELSGGQLQRVGIARALSVDPEVLILDEPVSALDVSVQAQILNLLRDLQQRRGLSYLFISHDMAVVKYLAHRVAVMYLGRVVELGATDDVLNSPRHPYTVGLLEAVPDLDREPDDVGPTLQGEQGAREAQLTGCRFLPRCPAAVDDCAVLDPALTPIGDHQVACLVRAREAGVEPLVIGAPASEQGTRQEEPRQAADGSGEERAGHGHAN